MSLVSDNWAGAHPAVAESLLRASRAYSRPYGEGDLDHKVEAALSEFFERDISVYFVATGTAANALSLSSVGKPGAIAFCHTGAHVIHHEGGAVEFLTGGTKLVSVAGRHMGKMDVNELRRQVARYPDNPHVGQKTAVTLTQATEAGTLYTTEEIAAISTVAKENGLAVHMDGARFANAVAALGVTPAEMTWKSGIDILSLGGTKNGCWCAEAVIFFDPSRASAMPYLRKRAAGLFSKSAFVAAQFDAWLQDGLWLDLATHANAMAARLATAIDASRAARLAWPSESNQVFAVLDDQTAARLSQAGHALGQWQTPPALEGVLGDGEAIYRFVASYATRPEDVDALCALL